MLVHKGGGEPTLFSADWAHHCGFPVPGQGVGVSKCIAGAVTPHFGIDIALKGKADGKEHTWATQDPGAGTPRPSAAGADLVGQRLGLAAGLVITTVPGRGALDSVG